MSDWNTLHLFNDKLFYSEVVPDFKGKGNLLRHYFNSQLGKYILWNNNSSEERIGKILSYCKFLDADFKAEVQNDFSENNANVIDDFQTILPLIIFSECAAFNPHLILGRRIFRGNIWAEPKSIAKEVISMVTDSGFSYVNQMGIINWVKCEDLKLLLLDKTNLSASSDETEDYFSDFITFVGIAVDNNLGVISVSNVNERVLNMIETPKVQIEIELEGFRSKCVIRYE